VYSYHRNLMFWTLGEQQNGEGRHSLLLLDSKVQLLSRRQPYNKRYNAVSALRVG
jgi:hypothetical protein